MSNVKPSVITRGGSDPQARTPLSPLLCLRGPRRQGRQELKILHLNKASSPVLTFGKNLPVRRHSKCKGPESNGSDHAGPWKATGSGLQILFKVWWEATWKVLSRGVMWPTFPKDYSSCYVVTEWMGLGLRGWDGVQAERPVRGMLLDRWRRWKEETVYMYHR